MSRAKVGEAPHNAGVEFQQRVSAWLLVCMSLQEDVGDYLALDSRIVPDTIRFETQQPIDDVQVSAPQNQVFIQIKHDVDLSPKADRELGKSIVQFVEQFLKTQGGTQSIDYVLATSPRASRAIRQDLRKVLNVIRADGAGFRNSPFSQAERRALTVYETLFSDIFKQQTGAAPRKQDFVECSRRVHIAIFDVDQGSPTERAAKMMLSTRYAVQPGLLWDALIARSLTYAAQRMSVDRLSLDDTLGKYEKRVIAEPSVGQDPYRLNFELPSKLPCGKEVLILRAPDDTNKVFLIEVPRFGLHGTRNVRFEGSEAVFQNGSRFEVLFRAGSRRAFEEMISDLNWLDSISEFLYVESEIPANLDDSEGARIHADVCRVLLESAGKLEECLHCGREISSGAPYVAEVDVLGLPHKIGIVHPACRRPTDRVLGSIRMAEFEELGLPTDFPARKWARLLARGQRVFRGIRHSGLDKNVFPIIHWKPGLVYTDEHRYCIKSILADGSTVYISNRGNVQRFTRSEAEERVNYSNAALAEARTKNDPFCYTSESRIFGVYSRLLGLLPSKEELIECVRSEIDAYSVLISTSFDEPGMYYAPICILRDAEGNTVMTPDSVVLISDPLEMTRLRGTWKRSGVDLEKFDLEIIESDEDFDQLMAELVSEELTALIDPVVDPRGSVISAIRVGSFAEFVAQNGRDSGFAN